MKKIAQLFFNLALEIKLTNDQITTFNETLTDEIQRVSKLIAAQDRLSAKRKFKILENPSFSTGWNLWFVNGSYSISFKLSFIFFSFYGHPRSRMSWTLDMPKLAIGLRNYPVKWTRLIPLLIQLLITGLIFRSKGLFLCSLLNWTCTVFSEPKFWLEVDCFFNSARSLNADSLAWVPKLTISNWSLLSF